MVELRIISLELFVIKISDKIAPLIESKSVYKAHRKLI